MTGENEPVESKVRRALLLIGEEAARSEEPKGAAVSTKDRFRGSALGLTLGSAAAAALVVGGLVLTHGGSEGASGPASNPDGPAGKAANSPNSSIGCFSQIVEGEVRLAKKQPRHRVEVSIAVTDWLKPKQGETTYEVTVLDPRQSGIEQPLVPGVDVLFMVPDRRDRPALIYDVHESPAVVKTIEHQAAQPESPDCQLASG